MFNPLLATALGDDLPGSVWIRTATPRDHDPLCDYFERLSPASRRNRFMGTVNNVATIARDCLRSGASPDRFTMLAETNEAGRDFIVGEASYAFDREAACGEFAISVADRWQGCGLGRSLLVAVQSRAVSLGYRDLYGETFKSNEEMRCLARKAGFAASRSPDWRAIRFDKRLIA